MAETTEVVFYRDLVPTGTGTKPIRQAMIMDPQEIAILEEIEAGIAESDAEFAARMADGPRLSTAHRVGLIMAMVLGGFLMALFPVNLLFGVAGYVVLVAAGTPLLWSRQVRKCSRPPLSRFHRLTGHLFRSNPSTPPPESGPTGWEPAA